jgi:hypothetical protein
VVVVPTVVGLTAASAMSGMPCRQRISVGCRAIREQSSHEDLPLRLWQGLVAAEVHSAAVGIENCALSTPVESTVKMPGLTAETITLYAAGDPAPLGTMAVAGRSRSWLRNLLGHPPGRSRLS